MTQIANEKKEDHLRSTRLGLLIALQESDSDKVLNELNKLRESDRVSDITLIQNVFEQQDLNTDTYLRALSTIKCIGENNDDCKRMACHVLRLIALHHPTKEIRSEALEYRLIIIAGKHYDPMGGAHIPSLNESSFSYRQVPSFYSSGGIIADLVGPHSKHRLRILEILNRDS